MEINKNILLECICYLCDYKFSNITHYQVYDKWILAEVTSYNDNYCGKKSVDVDMSEYQEFVRCKKLDFITKKLHN